MLPAAALLKSWRDDALKFAVECLHMDPDPWQADFLRAFSSHWQRLGLKACKGPGKTALLAACAWNFLATRLKPKIAATSITGDNLSDNLWPEMAKWQSKSAFLKAKFTWQKTRIYANDHPEEWFMSARTWPRAADLQTQAEALGGLHADYVMFILDESGGIPDAVAATAEGALATGRECKLLQAGNPDHLEGPLYRACTSERHLWYMQEITADPDDPRRATRVSVQWARDQIDKYGKDNPWVLVNVFGKFPPSSINVLLGPDEVETAMNRHYPREEYDYSQKRLGIDVARMGDDRTVLFARQGLRALDPVELRNANGPQVASRAALARDRWAWEQSYIDDTGGFGGSVIDSMLQAGMPHVPVNFSSRADDSRYLNRRAEIWFRMAEWIKRGGWLPKRPGLKRELTAPTYTFQNGKFKLEEKEQIKDRLGFSPDEADALALTFALPDMPTEETVYERIEEKYSKDKRGAKSEWDPLAELNKEPKEELREPITWPL